MIRKENCDFWVGNLENIDDYFDFLGEDPEFFQDDTDIDEKFISKFAKSHGENWIDHDFMESGFENEESSFFEKFKKYSYSSQWISVLSDKAIRTDLININTIVFITEGRIKEPTSVFGPKFTLQYVGQIEYNI